MVIMAVFAFFRTLLFTLAGERIVATVRRMLFKNISIQEIAFFDVVKTGELINRLSSDTVCYFVNNISTIESVGKYDHVLHS